MKKLLLTVMGALMIGAAPAAGESVTLNGKDYEVNRLIDRQIAPGVQYTRFRLPSYPLNINVITVDMTNPYNRIETTVANESAKGTESLVSAAKRQSSEGHRAVAGANANFWVVASQPEYPAYSGTTRNASVKNGKIVTESNQFNDKWDGGTMRTGVVAVSTDKKVYVDKCNSWIKVRNEKIDELDVYQSNKGVHPNELCMYNSFYGASRAFMPISDTWVEEDLKDATEIILDLNEGHEWRCGDDMEFVIKEIRYNAGRGTLGKHDLALVARGTYVDSVAPLAVGDMVTMNIGWAFRPNSEKKRVEPKVDNAIGGNAMVMIDGELTTYNTNETYNSQVYSRTGYGRSNDRNTLYICVIDKSTDPVYGKSNGCSTSVMCEFMKSLGCTDMANFDAGGSAEMLVNGKIINTTTESSPRTVANGFLVYSIAPEDDNTITTLAFDEISLMAPVYGSFEPKVIGYNKYGFPVDYDLKGFTLSCEEALGTCNGSVFTAGSTPMTGQLTATYGDATVTAEIEVKEAQLGIRIKPILIDATRKYPMEITAKIGEQVYTYDPADIEWTVADPEVAFIDETGTLHGLKEGSTEVSARLGDFMDTTVVNVEIAPAPVMQLDNWADGWTVKGSSGMNNAKLDANGTVTYTYASPRDSYIQLSKSLQFYSLPDRATFTFSSTLPVATIFADLRAANQERASLVKLSQSNGTETFAANTEYVVELPFGMLGDPNDLALYPISLHYLKFTTERSTDYRGDQSMTISDLHLEYDHFTTGVESVSAEQTTDPTAPVVYYNLQGVALDGTNLAPGIYIRRQGRAASKVLIK